MVIQKPWLHYYPRRNPATVTIYRKTVTLFLKKLSTEFPDKIAIHFLGKEFTYQYIYHAANTSCRIFAG